MRVQFSLAIILLLNIDSSAQSHGFQVYPSARNIESVEITKVVDGQEQRIEYTAFDDRGRIIFKQRKEGGLVWKTEETIYTDSSATTYKCTCENTLKLQQQFKPLGYRPVELGSGRRSAATNQSLVDISKLDKHGNPIATVYYFDDGYIQSSALSTYDANNRILAKDILDYKREPMYYERFRYDERGNVLEKITKFDVDPVEMRKYYTHDEKNRMTEVIAFMGDRLTSHSTFYTVQIDNTTNYYTVYHHKGDTVLISQTTLDSLGREEMIKTFQTDGSISELKTTEYYPSGRISKYTYQQADGTLRREEVFADVDQNPCYQIVHYIPTTVKTNSGRSTVLQPQVYLRKIRYRADD
jgi:hypothetical protein